MFISKDLGALCVLYNPSNSIVSNIRSWTKLFDRIIIVDNSDNNNVVVEFENYEKITVINNHDNLGIAKALNQGCKKAIMMGIKWLFTFDQDSKPEKGLLQAYTSYLENNANDNLGILTCKIKCCETDIIHATQGITDVLHCWTSGSLMNLNAYKSTNGFKDDLFIDYVDFAYCLDLRKKGYVIKRLDNYVLNHHLGNSVMYSIFGYKFYVTNHSPLRRYYMTRNSLRISKMYGKDFPEFKFTIIKLMKVIFKILIFENNKLEKLFAIKEGFLDYKSNHFGRKI